MGLLRLGDDREHDHEPLDVLPASGALSGRRVDRSRRAKDGWTQIGPNGVVRRMTAEQLLSHLLPPLASGRLRVRVEPDVIEREG